VRRLILVSSGPFEEHYTHQLTKTRFERLSTAEQDAFNQAILAFNQSDSPNREDALAHLGILAGKADNYDPLPDPDGGKDRFPLRGSVYQGVWESAAALRRSGELLNLGKKIHCPVTAIHGNYDPHPAAGVCDPLSSIIRDFKFILLDHCGHTPWLEKQARDNFYQSLKTELANEIP
jgi:pimeloyl-ACP methyl ester carboxylesterase